MNFVSHVICYRVTDKILSTICGQNFYALLKFMESIFMPQLNSKRPNKMFERFLIDQNIAAISFVGLARCLIELDLTTSHKAHLIFAYFIGTTAPA